MSRLFLFYGAYDGLRFCEPLGKRIFLSWKGKINCAIKFPSGIEGNLAGPTAELARKLVCDVMAPSMPGVFQRRYSVWKMDWRILWSFPPFTSSDEQSFAGGRPYQASLDVVSSIGFCSHVEARQLCWWASVMGRGTFYKKSRAR